MPAPNQTARTPRLADGSDRRCAADGARPTAHALVSGRASGELASSRNVGPAHRYPPAAVAAIDTHAPGTHTTPPTSRHTRQRLELGGNIFRTLLAAHRFPPRLVVGHEEGSRHTQSDPSGPVAHRRGHVMRRRTQRPGGGRGDRGRDGRRGLCGRGESVAEQCREEVSTTTIGRNRLGGSRPAGRASKNEPTADLRGVAHSPRRSRPAR